MGLENQDAVSAIDTLTNKVIATIPVGQQPQALVYIPDAVKEGAGIQNLTPLGDIGNAAHLELISPADSKLSAHATVSVNTLGALDLLQAAVSGLEPGHTYTLWLVSSKQAASAKKTALVTFKANSAGAQIAQAIAPLREILTSNSGVADNDRQQFLEVSSAENDVTVLVQHNHVP